MQEVAKNSNEEEIMRVSVKLCWCGNNTFHVLESREIVCADCKHYIEGEMVFSYDTDTKN